MDGWLLWRQAHSCVTALLFSSVLPFSLHFTLYRWEEGCGVQALFAQNKSWEHHEDDFFHVHRKLHWHLCCVRELIHMVRAHDAKNTCCVVLYTNNYLLWPHHLISGMFGPPTLPQHSETAKINCSSQMYSLSLQGTVNLLPPKEEKTLHGALFPISYLLYVLAHSVLNKEP